jgi:hypothetical protein
MKNRNCTSDRSGLQKTKVAAQRNDRGINSARVHQKEIATGTVPGFSSTFVVALIA